MDLEDFRHTRETRFECDVCIVGTGPAGLTIAQELAGSAARVLLIESGDVCTSADVDALSEVQSVGAPRLTDQSRVRARGFGGSSRVWNGRCVPLSALDLEERSWVPLSGWPLTPAELQPYLDRAAAYLDLCPVAYDGALEARLPARLPPWPAELRGAIEPCVWQWSVDAHNPSLPTLSARVFRERWPDNARVLLSATAAHIQVDANGRLAWLEIRSLNGRSARVSCKQLVLCAGGIESPRLLLASRNVHPDGLGNQHGMLGRCFMDHPRCALGHFELAAGARVRRAFMLQRVDMAGRPRYFARGLALCPELQHREQLLNCAGWLDARVAPDDPWHALKRLARRSSAAPWSDGLHIARQPHLLAGALARRFVARRPVMYKSDALTFLCDVEQAPDPDSRITLAEERDALGVPRARIDWRFGEREQRTVSRFGLLAQRAFAAMGMPALQLAPSVQAGQLTSRDFVDVAHPAGATRMASDPRRGVVDAQGQVHGVPGVFVTGTAVFPTNGHANPTLTLVALALRLADHLKARHLSRALPLAEVTAPPL